MSRKPSFSGNIELLKSINDVATSQFSIKEGNNIEFDYDVNNQTTTINVINTPKFDDVVLVNNISLLNELNAKYSIKNDVVIEDNSISLNLGTIDGLQVPTKQTQAVNKKYVDESLDYFWEQILKMNFVNFKGRFNDKLTYHTGDLVAYLDTNKEYYFYLSLIDLNNAPLTDTNAWIKVSTPIPNNLVTEDRLNLEIQQLEQKIENGDNTLNTKIDNLPKPKFTWFYIGNKSVWKATNKDFGYCYQWETKMDSYLNWDTVININFKNITIDIYSFSWYWKDDKTIVGMVKTLSKNDNFHAVWNYGVYEVTYWG